MVLLSCFLLEIDLVNISLRSYDPLGYSHVSYNQIIYQNFDLISTKILIQKIHVTDGFLPVLFTICLYLVDRSLILSVLFHPGRFDRFAS